MPTTVFLFLLLFIFFWASVSSDNRRILHQPFLPLDSIPPSQPPAPSSPPPPPDYPFSSSTPTNSPFFPEYPSPPPPPSPSSFASFPANISSLSVPQTSKPKPPSSKLVATAVACVVAAVVVVSIAVALHLRKVRNRSSSSESKTERSDISTGFNYGDNAGAGGGNPVIPKLRRPSQPSSEFLYLGTMVNSQGGIEPHNQQNFPSTTTTSAATSGKMDSPELQPLPPLLGRNLRQNYENAEPGSGWDEDDEFYSPRGSLGGRESSIGTGSVSRRAFAAIEDENFGGSNYSSSSSSSSSSGSGSPRRSVSLSISPPGSSSPKSSRPKSPELAAVVTAFGPPQHPPPPPPQPPVSVTQSASARESQSPSPASPSSPEGGSRKSIDSSPRSSQVWDHQNIDSPVRINSPGLNSPARISSPSLDSPVRIRSPIESPARISSPVVDSPVRISSSVVDSSVRFSSPAIESPAGISSSTVESTMRTSSPVMESLPRINSPVMESPLRIRSPGLRSPARTSSLMVESPSRISSPDIDYLARISFSAVESQVRISSPVIDSLPRINSPIMESPERASSPAMESPPRRINSLIMESLERASSPGMESPPRRTNSPIMESPERASSPLMESLLRRINSPIMESPERASSPLMESPPRRINSPIMESPERASSPVTEYLPRRINSPIMESPERANSPLMESPPSRINSPIMESLERASSPLMESPPRINYPDKEFPVRISDQGMESISVKGMESPLRISSPVIGSPVRISSLEVESPTRISSTVIDSLPIINNPVVESPARISSPIVESPPRINSPDMECPVRISSPGMQSPARTSSSVVEPLVTISNPLQENVSILASPSMECPVGNSISSMESPLVTSPLHQNLPTLVPPQPPVPHVSIPSQPPPPPPPPPNKHWESPRTPNTQPQKLVSEPPVLVNPLRPIAIESPTLISPIQLPSHLEPAKMNSDIAESYSSENVEKNEETPKPKLKPLHWDKVRATSDREMVWDQLKSSSFKLNEEMIETLFVVNTPNMNPKETVQHPILPSLSQENRVLDPKKSQNIAISLRALNVTTEEVCDALLEGNADTLGTELLESLMKMAPTKEEERKLKEFTDNSPFKLGPAEKFLKAVLDIPFAFERVDAMLYVSNFESEVDYLKKSFETLEAACEELRSSRMFLKLLEAVLKTGNRMNVGTNRGDAHAFKLDTLLKLVDIKGADGRTTLLHFVVQEIIRSEGARISTANQYETSIVADDAKCRKLGLQVVSSLSSELTNVKKAAAMDSEVLHSDVLKLSKGIVNITDVVRLNEAMVLEESNSQKFSESMNRFTKMAEEEIIKLQALESVAMSLVKEITEYFHGNSAKEEAHPFRIFMVVRDFLMILERVCKEVGMINERTIVSSAHRFPVPVNPMQFPVPVNPMLQPVVGLFPGRQQCSSSGDEGS